MYEQKNEWTELQKLYTARYSENLSPYDQYLTVLYHTTSANIFVWYFHGYSSLGNVLANYFW